MLIVASTGVIDSNSPVGATIRGTVQVTHQPSYTPQSGHAFDFVIGPVSGTPTNFILPTLSNNLAWVTNDWGSTGILSITNAGPTNNHDQWVACWQGFNPGCPAPTEGPRRCRRRQD